MLAMRDSSGAFRTIHFWDVNPRFGIHNPDDSAEVERCINGGVRN